MRIGIANDHRGVVTKEYLVSYLNGMGYEVFNYGTDTDDAVDFPDYAYKLGKGIISNEIDLGIAICGTGIGMSIAANKMEGIVAAKVNTPNEARLCREHNQANVMTLAEYTEDLFEVVDAFINTKPSVEERHVRRYNKIMQIK